jgi:hypothetical protein
MGVSPRPNSHLVGFVGDVRVDESESAAKGDCAVGRLPVVRCDRAEGFLGFRDFLGLWLKRLARRFLVFLLGLLLWHLLLRETLFLKM